MTHMFPQIFSLDEISLGKQPVHSELWLGHPGPLRRQHDLSQLISCLRIWLPGLFENARHDICPMK